MPDRQNSGVVSVIALSVVGTLIALVVVAYLAIVTGSISANADTPPGRLERWAAKRSLHATLDRDAKSLQEPLPISDSSLTEGVRLYGTNCAVCHGAADGHASPIASGLYVNAPQFSKDNVADDPVGVTYWKITHGIRLTGMPAFDSTLTPAQRWKIAGFLARQDSLPPGAAAAWKALPSAAAPFATNAGTTSGVVTVHASDYTFTAPDQVPAGMTTFRMVNDGPGFHHVDLIRIDSGKTIADLQQALKQPGVLPRWIVAVGGPNATDPHGESNATLDLAPGNYALVCFVDVPGGVPHFTKGMIRPLTVTSAAGTPRAAPTPDVTVTLSDYKFDGVGAMKAGRHVFLVRTAAGQQTHEILLLRLEPGKSVTDLMTWMGAPQGPPPAQALGGVSGVDAGRQLYFTADLTPGTYAFLCVIPDATDGKPHVMHGMVKTIVVS